MPFDIDSICLVNKKGSQNNTTLPWTQCAGVLPHGLRAPLCASAPVLCLAVWLHEHGTRALWQLLAAAEGQGFVQAVSDWVPCSGTPSAVCIHPPAPKGNKHNRRKDKRERSFNVGLVPEVGCCWYLTLTVFSTTDRKVMNEKTNNVQLRLMGML